MHQNPHFQLKPTNNWKIPKIRISSTIAIPESALIVTFIDLQVFIGGNPLGTIYICVGEGMRARAEEVRTRSCFYDLAGVGSLCCGVRHVYHTFGRVATWLECLVLGGKTQFNGTWQYLGLRHGCPYLAT